MCVTLCVTAPPQFALKVDDVGELDLFTKESKMAREARAAKKARDEEMGTDKKMRFREVVSGSGRSAQKSEKLAYF